MVMRPLSQHFSHGTLFTKQGIYEQSLTQQHRLGERLKLGARTFHYTYAGGTLSAGVFVEAAALGGATTTLQNTQAVTVAAAIGATRVYVNALTTAQTADVFADGYAAFYDAGASDAYTYLVKGNSALATSGTSSYIDLYDELHIALNTDDQVSLITNPYKAVVTGSSTSALAGAVMGVPPIAVTSTYYFWLQTWGPCAVMISAALDFDEYITISDTTAGYFEPDSASALTNVLGQTLHVGTSGEVGIINLMISP